MNTKFEIWLNKVNEERKSYWDNNYSHKPYQPLTYRKGSKYIKIIDDGSVWGFVSMKDGWNKGVFVNEGDLMKAEGRNSAARWSRGNIFDGTDSWEYYGPTYLK